MTDDDLNQFADEPILRALTGAGTPEELAGETDMLAAFRASVPKRSRRRLAARLGAGGSVFIAVAALSGGVAAATYTNSMPSPVQNFAHSIGSWAGIPKAKPVHHKAAATPSRNSAATPVVTPTGADTSRTGVSPGPIGSPSATPTVTSHPGGVPGSRVHSPSPAITPSVATSVSTSSSPATVQTPTPTPTPTVTPSVAAALSASVSASRVPANTGVTLNGALTTAAGVAVPNHRIVAYEKPVGAGKPSKLGHGTTDANGDVSFAVPGLMRNVRLILRAGNGLHSAPVTVTEVPTVSAAVISNGSVASINVSTVGAAPGDTVLLLRRQQGAWLAAGEAQLDSNSGASFAVPTSTGRPVRYRVVLKQTPEHAQSAVGCKVVPS